MRILGMMSGTSLDGIDLALCDFDGDDYRIHAAATVPYSAAWRQRLSTLEEASALDYARAHAELGHLFGRTAHEFLQSRGLHADAIASHGHTIFHQPAIGLTTQIGDPDAIAAETGLPVVGNFRTLDVALGGQGAPLVPIGDALLFGDYDACLNLGGIANISYTAECERVAYDICPCNMALNRLAGRLGMDYDADGAVARGGRVDEALLRQFDDLNYYSNKPPKSLGKEWFISQFWSLLEASSIDTPDLLATVTRHIAVQISQVLRSQSIGTLLVTGGGAFNTFLIDTLRHLAPQTVVTVPDADTVNFKEALIFAFLGYLRINGRINTLRSVTGARCDSIGGTLSGILPPTA